MATLWSLALESPPYLGSRGTDPGRLSAISGCSNSDAQAEVSAVKLSAFANRLKTLPLDWDWFLDLLSVLSPQETALYDQLHCQHLLASTLARAYQCPETITAPTPSPQHWLACWECLCPILWPLPWSWCSQVSLSGWAHRVLLLR